MVQEGKNLQDNNHPEFLFPHFQMEANRRAAFILNVVGMYAEKSTLKSLTVGLLMIQTPPHVIIRHVGGKTYRDGVTRS